MGDMTDNEHIQASVGDFVEIIANTNEHEFEIGQVVTVVEWESDFGDYDDTDYGVECAPINGGNCWFVRHTDYRITAHPSEYEQLREQNTLMLSALEDVRDSLWSAEDEFNTVLVTNVTQQISAAIAQVKALTVSKQRVSTDSEDDCEQPTKDPSLVARQDTSNKPTEHSYPLAQHDLAKEVDADKLWRGEKT